MKYMMATKATHQLGDISRDEPGLCEIYNEDGDDFIGEWVTGFGFINVRFPKETTRPLTEAEVEYYSKRYVQISDQPPRKLNVRESA